MRPPKGASSDQATPSWRRKSLNSLPPISVNLVQFSSPSCTDRVNSSAACRSRFSFDCNRGCWIQEHTLTAHACTHSGTAQHSLDGPFALLLVAYPARIPSSAEMVSWYPAAPGTLCISRLRPTSGCPRPSCSLLAADKHDRPQAHGSSWCPVRDSAASWLQLSARAKTGDCAERLHDDFLAKN